MSNAPPELIDRLKNFIQQQNGQYPTIPANPNYTTPERFIQPPPSMSLPFRQGGAPPLAGVAAMGNPDIAQAFQDAGPTGPNIPGGPYQPPPPNQLLMGQSLPGLLG